MGGAVAIDLASRVDVQGLILEGAFSSTADMARMRHPMLPTLFIENNRVQRYAYLIVRDDIKYKRPTPDLCVTLERPDQPQDNG